MTNVKSLNGLSQRTTLKSIHRNLNNVWEKTVYYIHFALIASSDFACLILHHYLKNDVMDVVQMLSRDVVK